MVCDGTAWTTVTPAARATTGIAARCSWRRCGSAFRRAGTLASKSMDRGRLILQRALEPIKEPVTKIGGLPVWVDEPAWPRSAATGEQMLFIGQVVISRPLFAVEAPRIAYLFITEDTQETVGLLETWSPDSGENAVIIQAPSVGRPPTIIPGRTLKETYWEAGTRMTRPLELAATVSIEPVPADVPADEVLEWDSAQRIEYENGRGQQVGGIPDWIQHDEGPEGWQLLLQISDYVFVAGETIQTNWNFGTGSCYVMISPDYEEGILLWQC